MKKLLCYLCLLAFFLCGCGENPPVATEPLPDGVNPLNGQALSAPFTGRIFACTVNNTAASVPYQGLSQADIVFEAMIHSRATRCLALFSDVTAVPAIGPVHTACLDFATICQSYDAIFGHAGLGINDENGLKVEAALTAAGTDHLHLGKYNAYRDQNRLDAGYALDHSLMISGQSFYDAAAQNGIELTRAASTDYGLRFTADGTPTGGEAAAEVHISFRNKITHFFFNPDSGTYDLYLHGNYIVDETSDQQISFENLLVIRCPVEADGEARIARTEGSGDGFFACNGQLIPIFWHHEDPSAPFTFTLTDGTPLLLGIGNTYIALAPSDSTVVYA